MYYVLLVYAKVVQISAKRYLRAHMQGVQIFCLKYLCYLGSLVWLAISMDAKKILNIKAPLCKHYMIMN